MSKKFPDNIRNQWKEKIINQTKSGLSIAEWCRQNNIPCHIFFYWRTKLFPNTSIDRSAFKEISEQQNVETQNQKSGICIQYQEFFIHLDQKFDMAILRQCLKAVKELPC